ncbi:MAG: mechanosensitive ion channel family protein [Candidatus Eremiobacteraeota bacterium]|nr:mechanosensitive ion channel family protein [Candidatus Eremiobacteraeota bacterium]
MTKTRNPGALLKILFLFLCLLFLACALIPPHSEALPGLPSPHHQPPAVPPEPSQAQAAGSASSSATTPPSPAPPSPASTLEAPPDEAPVMLNNRALITVRGDSGHRAAERAGIIERRIEEVLKRAKSAPSIDIDTVDETPVIKSGGLYLISVTNSDAAPLGISVSDLAASWRDELEKGIRRTWHERSEGYTEEALIRSLYIILIGIALTIIGIFVFQRFLKLPGFLFILIIWLSVISAVLWLFPDSRPWSRNLVQGVLIPILTFLITFIVVMLLFKPTDAFVMRFFDIFEKIRDSDLDQRGRGLHRLAMLRVVGKVIAKTVLILIAGLLYLNSLHVDLTAALAGAGIIGVGLGIASQDLLKDYMAGFFFVFEDQFAVGDNIRAGAYEGTVEDFTLRITRLRDMEGRLISIPNSVIRTVENQSSGWSQVDFTVHVAYRNNLAKAMALLIETARELRADWKEIIIADPEMLGVEGIDESGVKLRMVMKTKPLSQWKVRRELLKRIKSRFDMEGIEIPFPQRSVWLRDDKDKVLDSHEPQETPAPQGEAGSNKPEAPENRQDS